MEILSGDIGGTTTRLALFRVDGSGLKTLQAADYVSNAWPALGDIIKKFVSDYSLNPQHACFGIAGPIKNRKCQVTALPWLVDADQLATDFEFQQVELINDLEANAWGINALSDEDFCLLNAGDAKLGGNGSIISAGTGLGEAGLYWDGHAYQPFASEGGHADFCPSSTMEFALFQWLAEKYGHVSWERVISGPGLVDIYRFICAYHAAQAKPFDAAEISRQALQSTNPLCNEALNTLVRCFAAEAGNHALTLMATGGVYIGGGIAPKILPRLQSSVFMDTFCAKGRMSELMRSMPVKVILNPRTALYGSAICLYHQLKATD